MSNDKYIKNRKIVYQCSYCGIQYVNVDNCPSCHASTADSKVLEDNLDAMLTNDLEEQRTEVVTKGKFTAYMVITVLHMFSCVAWVGFLFCPVMLIVHLVYHLVKRKIPHPVVIIDASLSLIMTIVFVCVARYIELMKIKIYEIFGGLRNEINISQTNYGIQGKGIRL